MVTTYNIYEKVDFYDYDNINYNIAARVYKAKRLQNERFWVFDNNSYTLIPHIKLLEVPVANMYELYLLLALKRSYLFHDELP